MTGQFTFAVCPACQRNRPLRSDGRFRRHGVIPSDSPGAPVVRPKTCLGSGQLAPELAPRTEARP